MLETEWEAKKINDKIHLRNSELFKEYSKSLPEDKPFQIVIRDIPKPKTDKQNKTFWMVLDKARQLMAYAGIDSSYLYNLPNSTGVKITKGMLHQWVYVMFPHFDEHGELITMSSPKWTSKMSSDVIDGFRNYLASQLGLVIDIDSRE